MAATVKSQSEPLVVRYWSPWGGWTLRALLRAKRVAMVALGRVPLTQSGVKRLVLFEDTLGWVCIQK